MRYRDMRPAVEFEELVRGIIEDLNLGSITPDESLRPGDVGFDIEFSNAKGLHLVECKVPGPQTRHRVRATIEQLLALSERVKERTERNPRLILATPANLSPEASEQFRSAGIQVWDHAWLASNAVRVGRAGQATLFLGELSSSDSDRRDDHADDLLEQLAGIPAGPDWLEYQKLCRAIAEFLFCPPLSSPLWERKNFSSVNRRDLILPNYAPDGLWKYLRTRYQADYVVIDAKNYSESVKKDEILQISNYLQRHGVGLFALIFSRTEPDSRLLYTLREQWVLHDKIITVLSDSDVRQMLSDKKAGTDPAELIRQKIEDFRLGV